MSQNPNMPVHSINTSGRGKGAVVPDEVKDKFNWGAFLLSWIWGLFHKSYIALITFLLAFVPFIGPILILAFNIWYGINGNTIAWQNKKYESVEKFHENQKKWATAGIILAIIGTIISIIFYFAMFTFFAVTQGVK